MNYGARVAGERLLLTYFPLATDQEVAGSGQGGFNSLGKEPCPLVAGGLGAGVMLAQGPWQPGQTCLPGPRTRYLHPTAVAQDPLESRPNERSHGYGVDGAWQEMEAAQYP